MKAYLFPVAALCSLGCGSSKAECACDDPSIQIQIPAGRASEVVDVVPSGPACDGAAPVCARMSAGSCVLYTVKAVAAGACHIDIDFSEAPSRFSADLDTVDDTCCGAFYASPRSSGEIDVPDAPDAGGAG